MIVGFGCADAIKYSYSQGMHTYVLVQIKYLLTFRTKFTYHLRNNIDTPSEDTIGFQLF